MAPLGRIMSRTHQWQVAKQREERHLNIAATIRTMNQMLRRKESTERRAAGVERRPAGTGATGTAGTADRTTTSGIAATKRAKTKTLITNCPILRPERPAP